jgi:hypothetical protein
VDGHYINYVACFEDWCRHWARDKKWDVGLEGRREEMTIKKCDRCGIKIRTNPMMGTRLPKFFINRRVDGFPLEWKSVDLCPRCEKKLAEWLNNNEEGPAPYHPEGDDKYEG